MILVVGALYQDSGKTTMARALVERALHRGVDGGVCKPITTFNGWYQFQALRRSEEMGLLTGQDLLILHQAASSGDPLEREGPLVAMVMPIDPERLDWRRSASISNDLLGRLMVMRITGREGSYHYFVPDNIRRTPPSLREVMKPLLRSLKPSPIELGPEQVESVLANSTQVIDPCLRWMARRHELLVVESYSDIAVPVPSTREASTVVAVAPGRMAVVDGEVFRTALDASASIGLVTQRTTDSFLGLVKREMSFPLSPGRFDTKVLDAVIDRELEASSRL
jgi:predicted P-loop ATPase/GTPase